MCGVGADTSGVVHVNRCRGPMGLGGVSPFRPIYSGVWLCDDMGVASEYGS